MRETIEIIFLIACVAGAIITLRILLNWDLIISLADSLMRKNEKRH